VREGAALKLRMAVAARRRAVVEGESRDLTRAWSFSERRVMVRMSARRRAAWTGSVMRDLGDMRGVYGF
jgi:hypothetical protein